MAPMYYIVISFILYLGATPSKAFFLPNRDELATAFLFAVILSALSLICWLIFHITCYLSSIPVMKIISEKYSEMLGQLVLSTSFRIMTTCTIPFLIALKQNDFSFSRMFSDGALVPYNIK